MNKAENFDVNSASTLNDLSSDAPFFVMDLPSSWINLDALYDSHEAHHKRTTNAALN